MINFIICDDNKKIKENVSKIVDTVMMKNDIEYKKYEFEDYDKNFEKIIDIKIPNKIYILDIETKSNSGINIAKKIRDFDLNSMIIFLTSHEYLGQTILKSEFLFLSFICKFEDYESRLEKSIDKAIKFFGEKRILHFKTKDSEYTIPEDSILYIKRDTVERKSIIVTDAASIKLSKSLSEFESLLSPCFWRSHKGALVNKKRMISKSYPHKKITFDNNLTIDLISYKYKEKK